MIKWIKIPACGLVEHDFAIMENPVTNADYCEWLNCLGADEAKGHYCKLMSTHFFGGINENYTPKSGFGNKPVVFVSWHDAQGFASWIGGRLPTAVEWRKAAAWIPLEGRFAKYCTGHDDAPNQNDAIFYDDVDGWALPYPHLADVDWYRPSGAYGLRGMAGNVGEWVDAERANGWKLALGGSLFRPVEQTLTFAAEADRPDKRLSTFGFRLVRMAINEN